LRRIRKYYWKTGGFSCPAYDGPAIAWLVTACKAPDGTYWAVQSWQRLLPDYGVTPTPVQSAWEVHLAHWQGPLPELKIQTDSAWHQWDHLFGIYTYDGSPVFGFKSTSVGAPLDSFGRNLYVDTGCGRERLPAPTTRTPTRPRTSRSRTCTTTSVGLTEFR
jgi:hypothetical protein